jgi:hypothetical protein
MDAQRFAAMLTPIAATVFVGGWILAVISFFIIGTETCAEVEIPLAGPVEVCQDTTAEAVILLTVIGFTATVGSLFLVALRFMLLTLAEIAENTRTDLPAHPEESKE